MTHVAASAPDQTAAACLAALLREQGRAMPVSRVQEACAPDGEMDAGAMQAAARAFGLACRQLTIGADDLRFAREPLILESRARRFVLVDADRRGRLRVMDPLDAARGALGGDFDAIYTGRCFELRPDTVTSPRVASRVQAFVRGRRQWLARVVFAIGVLQVSALGTPIIAGFVLDQVIVTGDASRLSLAALAFAAIIGLMAVHSAVKASVMRYLRTHFDRELLDQLMGHLLALPLRFFNANDAGSLLQRFQTFRAVRSLLGGDPPVILLELLVLNVSTLVLLILQPGLAALVLGVGLLSFVVGAVCLRPLRRLVEEELDADAEQQDRLIELMRGVATLRVTGHQDGGASRWMPFFLRKLDARFRQERLAVLEFTLIDGLRAFVLAILIWRGAAGVLDGAMSIGAFVAFYGIAGAMLGALTATASKLVPAAHVGVHLARIRDVFDAAPEQDRALARPPGRLRGRITLEDVSFTYDGAVESVLRNIALDIEPGMTLAVVGASGSGKSTLAGLLLGFHKPDTGRILYDGRDLWGLDLTAVRRQLGVVLQDTYLFSGSIRQNVALGAPDSTVDDVWRAIAVAGVEPDVRALPMQLETFVAEAGGAFSGGQRQRLAIARALVRQPPIVLLDEATSALDNVSQGRVEDGLTGLACTRVVIAHRLSTVIDADCIVVLDAGRIVEQGTHGELLALGGQYARLMRPQMADVV